MDSRAWDERYAAKDLVWGGEPNRWVVRETQDLPPGTALDLAAGEGRNAVWLAARGWRATAVDFSAVALERGRRLATARPDGAADRLTWVLGDVSAGEAVTGTFDLVLMIYLHLPAAARRRVLVRAARSLAPGGRLLVVGHDATNLTEGIGGPQDPAVLFTPEDVLADLDGAGLETVRAERVRRPVEAPGGGTVEAIDALVHLRRP